MVLDPPLPVLDLSPEIDSLWSELTEAFHRVLRSKHFINGPEVAAFEAEVAAHLGTRHAVGLNSGTDALVLALRALGIGHGDEVITTPFTFFATAEAIGNVGARPIFVDVDEATMNIDPAAVARSITHRTRALLPVHLFGRPVKMAPILDLAERFELYVVEDCAQSFGARVSSRRHNLNGRMTGTVGQVGCFSFFPSKNLGGFGDGGLLTTDDDGLAAQARQLRAHGSTKKYFNERLGYNSRLDALQAALLRVKLPHSETMNAGRRRVAAAYHQALAGVDGLVLPEIVPGHVFHQFTVRVLDGRRAAVADALEAEGIATMVYYPVPLDRLPIYAGQYPRLPVSERLSTEVLSLPIWPTMSESDIARVADALRRALGQPAHA